MAVARLFPSVTSRLAVAGFGLIAILLVAGVVWAASSRGTQGGLPPVLDVPQSTSADSNGVVLSISAARFSATATFVRFEADVAAWEAATGEKAAQLSIAADAWGKGIGGGGAAVSLKDGPDSFARLDAVTLEPPYDVVVTRVDILTGSGVLTPVEGEWRLQLEPPAALSAALRTERLAGSQPVSTEGITLRATGGRRSTTETLVTIEVSPAGVQSLSEPRLISGKNQLRGILSDEQDNGALLTFAFPPTRFGDAVRLEFDTFRVIGDGARSEVRVDMGRAMGEQGVSGKDAEVVRFSANHLHGVAGEAMPPLSTATFYYLPHAQVGPITVVRLEFAANYDPVTTSFQVFGGTGRQLRVTSWNDKYRKDQTGTILPGTFELDVEVRPEDLTGQITVIMGSAPTSVVRGLWRIDLAVDTSTP